MLYLKKGNYKDITSILRVRIRVSAACEVVVDQEVVMDNVPCSGEV